MCKRMSRCLDYEVSSLHSHDFTTGMEMQCKYKSCLIFNIWVIISWHEITPRLSSLSSWSLTLDLDPWDFPDSSSWSPPPSSVSWERHNAVMRLGKEKASSFDSEESNMQKIHLFLVVVCHKLPIIWFPFCCFSFIWSFLLPNPSPVEEGEKAISRPFVKPGSKQ